VANRSSTKRRRNLRRALQSKLLLYLRAVGAVAAKENAELARRMLANKNDVERSRRANASSTVV